MNPNGFLYEYVDVEESVDGLLNEFINWFWYDADVVDFSVNAGNVNLNGFW